MLRISPAQRKVLERLKKGNTCVYSAFREAWQFIGDPRCLRFETYSELFDNGLVMKQIQGRGNDMRRYLRITPAGLAFLADVLIKRKKRKSS